MERGRHCEWETATDEMEGGVEGEGGEVDEGL